MAKVLCAWAVDQSWLSPPSPLEVVPAGHMAYFTRDTVHGALDLSPIIGADAEERGYPPCHPGTMAALLLAGCGRGLDSRRQLAHAREERADINGDNRLNRPDFLTSADFRKRHLAALSCRCYGCARRRGWSGSRTWLWTAPG